MPTFDIKEITEMKLVDMDTGKEFNLNPSTITELSLTERISEFSVAPMKWDNGLTWEFECPQTDYYKIRNALIGRGKKKYRYKQIHNVFKRWGGNE